MRACWITALGYAISSVCSHVVACFDRVCRVGRDSTTLVKPGGSELPRGCSVVHPVLSPESRAEALERCAGVNTRKNKLGAVTTPSLATHSLCAFLHSSIPSFRAAYSLVLVCRHLETVTDSRPRLHSVL